MTKKLQVKQAMGMYMQVLLAVSHAALFTLSLIRENRAQGFEQF